MSWLISKIKSPKTPEQETETNNHHEEEESAFSSIINSIFSAVSLGSDVMSSGISLPCGLYEPLSILQRQCELIEYSEVLDKMVEMDDPIAKMAQVVGFAISAYSATQRYYTNFNPLLGETFEYRCEEKGIHYLSEQVSHHPPVTAINVEGNGWTLSQNSSPNTSFGGNSIDLFTNGRTYIRIPETGDIFYYTNPQTRIHNILIGTLWVEHFGDLEVTNYRTGDTCTIRFHKAGFFGSLNPNVDGFIKNSQGENKVKIEGIWNRNCVATYLDTKVTKEVWRSHGEENIVHQKYKYTQFSEKLIQLDKELLQLLPPTDSRLRLDRTLLQRNESRRATQLKKIIEEKQRADRRERAERNEEWNPVYFHCVEENGSAQWVYSGNYWDQRDEKLELIREDGSHEHLLNAVNILNTAADFRSYEAYPELHSLI